MMPKFNSKKLIFTLSIILVTQETVLCVDK